MFERRIIKKDCDDCEIWKVWSHTIVANNCFEFGYVTSQCKYLKRCLWLTELNCLLLNEVIAKIENDKIVAIYPCEKCQAELKKY